MKLKGLAAMIIAAAAAATTAAYAADYTANERGIVDFSETVDVSQLDLNEGYDKYMSYKVVDANGGLQGFGQINLDSTGRVAFSVRIKGATGEYKIILSNIKLGQRTYTVDYVNNCYVEFNDIRNSGNADEMKTFITESGSVFGFDTYVFGLLSDGEQNTIVNKFLQAPVMNSNNDLRNFAESTDVLSVLFKTASADTIDEYIKTSTGNHTCIFNEAIAKVYIEKLTEANRKAIAESLRGKNADNALKSEFEFSVLKSRISQITYFADMDEIISDSNNIWGFARADLNKYAQSDKAEVQKQMQSAINSVSDMASYRNRFTAIVNDNYKGGTQNPSGSQTIITGSGTVKKSFSINIPDKPQDDNQNGETTRPQTGAFTDMAGYEWASAAVKSLVDNFIVNGTTDTTYEPSRPIKREEFVKMITAGLRLTGAEANVTMADVKESDWFYSAVGAAERANLITGDNDGNFGAGQYITRQDAAVIASRAAKYKGVSLVSEKDITFTDEADMASYAKNEIYKLARAGVINGMDDGSFAPRNNITRAEAAKLLYGLFTVIDVLVW